MITSTKTYAEAMFRVAQDESKVDEIYEELKLFKLLAQDPDVSGILNATLLDDEVLEPIWTMLKLSFKAEVINFIKVLHEAHLLRDFNRIVDEYRDFMVEEQLLYIVKIVSARELSRIEMDELTAMISNRYKGPFEITSSVDNMLINGLYITINNDIYDTSIKGKLDHILNQGGLINE